jgi:hypothetical protein
MTDPNRTSNEHNNAPAVPTDSDPTSKEQYRRMFVAACEALGAISDALGCDPEDGGAEPILGAVEELQISLGLSNGILGCLSAAPAVPQGLPAFDDLDDDVIDAACTAGSLLYRVDLMRAYECIRKALAATPAPAPAQEVGLTEAERVMCLIASGCIGTVKMTYDSGPYEITRTSINASRLIDAIIAALRAKGGK